MKYTTLLLSLTVLFLISGVVMLTATKASAQQPPPPVPVEYKVVTDLNGSGSGSAGAALDAFTKKKDGTGLEVQLRLLGKDGWKLAHYDRTSGFAIFMR